MPTISCPGASGACVPRGIETAFGKTIIWWLVFMLHSRTVIKYMYSAIGIQEAGSLEATGGRHYGYWHGDPLEGWFLVQPA
jgi:hypothetical protein